MLSNAEQCIPAWLFSEGKEGQREGRLSHQHKEHPPGQVPALLQKPIRCCLGLPSVLPASGIHPLQPRSGQPGSRGGKLVESPERRISCSSPWRAGQSLLLLLVLMVLDPAGWALAVPLLSTLTQPPASSDSSDTKKAKYVSSNLENRFPVQTARLRQNTAYLHGRDRGREHWL